MEISLLRDAQVDNNFTGKIHLGRVFMTVTSDTSRTVFYRERNYDYWYSIYKTNQLHFKRGLFRGMRLFIQGLLDGRPLVFFEREDSLSDSFHQDFVISV